MKNIFVDSRIDEEERQSLIDLKYSPITCPKFSGLYDAISRHPDILIHILGKNNIMVHKDMDADFICNLESIGFNVTLSQNSLGYRYPEDIILNAINLNDKFIHNLKYTDPNLKELVKNKKLININQGYSKCSTSIVSNNAIMTSDSGIAKTLYADGFDVLLLNPGNILLPGLNYGFIGGCSGLLESNLMAFYGSLDFYPQGKEVWNFLKKHKIDCWFLRKGPLIDRGSILRCD